MKTMYFKTNAKCGGCVAQIAAKLNNILSAEQWSIDLTTADRVLSVTSDLSPQTIVEAVQAAGFFAEPINE